MVWRYLNGIWHKFSRIDRPLLDCYIWLLLSKLMIYGAPSILGYRLREIHWYERRLHKFPQTKNVSTVCVRWQKLSGLRPPGFLAYVFQICLPKPVRRLESTHDVSIKLLLYHFLRTPAPSDCFQFLITFLGPAIRARNEHGRLRCILSRMRHV